MKKYEKYKDSGIEWIGEIPEHWEIVRLKYNFKFNTGFTPPSGKNEYYEDGKHIWITIADMNNKFISDSERKLSDIAIEEFHPLLLPIGTLLYSFKLSVGKVAFTKVECYTNEAIFSVLPKENTNLRFFFYSLPEQVIKNANENIYGAKILNQELIKNSLLIIPSSIEQTAIADYLDRKTAEIDALIAKKEQLLKLYEEEKTAIINQVVTKGINSDVKMKDSGIEWLGQIPAHWEVKKFKYYFNLITEKNNTDGKKIGLENIESKTGRLIETDSEFEGEGISFKVGDILFGKLRPYLAKVYLAKFDGKAVGDFYVFRSKGEVQPEFGALRILDYSFIDVANSSTYGAKMPRVSWEFIANLEIAFPPTKEHTAIVAHIEKESARIDSKISKTQKLIDLLKEYRTALISEAVTGKIKITEK